MCDEIGQNALTVALFEQPPQGPIRPKSNNLCAHQIANDKTVILSTKKCPKSPLLDLVMGVSKRE